MLTYWCVNHIAETGRDVDEKTKKNELKRRESRGAGAKVVQLYAGGPAEGARATNAQSSAVLYPDGTTYRQPATKVVEHLGASANRSF